MDAMKLPPAHETISALLAELQSVLKPLGSRVTVTTTADEYEHLAKQFKAIQDAAGYAEAACHRAVADPARFGQRLPEGRPTASWTIQQLRRYASIMRHPELLHITHKASRREALQMILEELDFRRPELAYLNMRATMSDIRRQAALLGVEIEGLSQRQARLAVLDERNRRLADERA